MYGTSWALALHEMADVAAAIKASARNNIGDVVCSRERKSNRMNQASRGSQSGVSEGSLVNVNALSFRANSVRTALEIKTITNL
jgi:hypothetical protein